MSATVIAAQMHTVGRTIRSRADVITALKRVRAMGYKAVQMGGGEPITAAELKKVLDGEGLTLSSLQLMYKRVEQELPALIEECRLFGTRYIAIAVLPDRYWSREGYEKFLDETSAAAEKLGAEDLVLCYHNHEFEFKKFGDRTGMDILFSRPNPPCLCSELDTYWVQYGGGDPVKWIRRLTGRIPLIHLKDMAIRAESLGDRAQLMTEVGDGNLDWPAILPACKEAGVAWYIVERDSGERDPFESLEVSLKNLNEMGLE